MERSEVVALDQAAQALELVHCWDDIREASLNLCPAPLCTLRQTPQPGGDVSTCQRGVTGCRGVSRDVTEMSRECRRNVAGCRGMSRECRGNVAGCRRSSTCHGNVAECRRCHGNVADVARMSPECRGNVAGCHRGVTECQLPSHLDQRVDMSTHPHQAGGYRRARLRRSCTPNEILTYRTYLS